MGHFFTEFGRTNPRHPHTWHWLDQPIVLSRLFGGDGLRGPGARLEWLLPVPWFSELHLGAQNADGETMLSFLASEETFGERAIGGRPFAPAGTRGAADLTTLVRWVNGLDLGDTWSAQLGLSWLSGPNAAGGSARTDIVGADVVAKWRPLATDQGWPFLIFEAEAMARRYEADRFVGCPVAEDASGCPVAPVALAADVLRDRGAYAQVLYGNPHYLTDPVNGARVAALLRDVLARERLTILFVTHRLDVAARYATHVALFHDGRVQAGPRERMLRSDAVARAFGTEPHAAAGGAP